MSSFVYATDIHLTDNQPVNRLDPIYPFCLFKLNQIFYMAERYGDGNLVLGGDLFENPCPSYTLLEKTINLFGTFSKSVKTYLIRGNHDLKFLNDFQETGVSVLHAAKLLYMPVSDFQLGDFCISTYPYSRKLPCLYVGDTVTKRGKYSLHSWTKPVHDPETPEEIKMRNSIHISVAHLPIVSEPVPYQHILCSDIGTDADILLCGHIHAQFEKTIPASSKTGVCHVLNPGCVTRLKRNEKSIVPGVYVITGSCGQVSYKFLPIKNVTSIDHVKFAEEEKELVSFTHSMEEKKIDIDDVTSYIQGSTYPEPVRSEALKLVQEKQGEGVNA